MELRYWWERGNEENKNKLVEWKTFAESVRIKKANLEDEFLVLTFAAFCVTILLRNAIDCRALVRLVK